MQKLSRRIVFSGILFLATMISATPSPAQMGMGGQPLSPPAKASCQFPDRKSIQVAYSSPRMRGRTIFGGLVPYGEPWRAGANEATTFVPGANVNVGGTEVPAGSYTLFAIPTPAAWTLIISKATGEWGIPYPGKANDFARVPMKVSQLSAPLENFTISFQQASGACTMRLAWEKTEATVRISEKK